MGGAREFLFPARRDRAVHLAMRAGTRPYASSESLTLTSDGMASYNVVDWVAIVIWSSGRLGQHGLTGEKAC